jgi:hypothetical protein
MSSLGLCRIEMQKHVERSGKDYATPMTFVLSYYINYANYALDHLQANLHKMTLLQYASQVEMHEYCQKFPAFFAQFFEKNMAKICSK